MRTARLTPSETSRVRSESVVPTTWTRFGDEGTAIARAVPAAAPFTAVPVGASAFRSTCGANACRWCDGRVTTIVAATAAATGSARTSPRRHVRRRGGAGAAAAISRTRSRTSGGASTRAARSSAARSRCDMESLLELLERPVQARRAVGGGDAEDAGGGARVEVEQDAERDHLALAGAEPRERRLEVGREPLAEARLDALRRRRQLLASRPASFGAEVVEGDRARDLAEPRA